MFMGAFDQPIPWSTNGARGCRRFLDRVWRLTDMLQIAPLPEGGGGAADGGSTSREMRGKVHACIKKVTEDYERMKFNTAIAAMMSLVNDFTAAGKLTPDELRTLLLLLSPVAPHICEEMNEALGYPPLHHAPWPEVDESALIADEIEYGIQVNGKIRARVSLPANFTPTEIEQAALTLPDLAPFLAGKTVRKVIVVRNVVNIVAN
ncbi:MAG: class I tRNA ligase family protein, partial [Clostridiales bacterium]|nr:class I tRNA ligase family protein [Clostridiales bacterium]